MRTLLSMVNKESNSMEQNPWEVNNHTTDQEINHICGKWNSFPCSQEPANCSYDELIKTVSEFQ
jgi:hypothetical protein